MSTLVSQGFITRNYPAQRAELTARAAPRGKAQFGLFLLPTLGWVRHCWASMARNDLEQGPRCGAIP